MRILRRRSPLRTIISLVTAVLFLLTAGLPGFAVTITSPKPLAQVSGLIRVSAMPNDEEGQFAYAFLLVDDSRQSVSNVTPMRFDLNTSELPNGVHLLKIELSDMAGLLSTSKTVKIIVMNPIPGMTPLVAKPQPKPVAVTPQPKPIAVTPQPKPVAVSPQPKPVAITPTPKPVVVAPQPNPIVVAPAPKPVVASTAAPKPAPVLPAPMVSKPVEQPKSVAVAPQPKPLTSPVAKATPSQQPAVVQPKPIASKPAEQPKPVVAPSLPAPVASAPVLPKPAVAQPVTKPAPAQPAMSQAPKQAPQAIVPAKAAPKPEAPAMVMAPVNAQPITPQVIKQTPRPIHGAELAVMLNGKPLSLAVKPVIDNGRAMVLLRPLVEALGGKLEWDPVNKQVFATVEDRQYTFSIGESTVLVDGQEMPIGHMAVIVASRTMVPVAVWRDLFGGTLQYDPEYGSISLFSKPRELPSAMVASR